LNTNYDLRIIRCGESELRGTWGKVVLCVGRWRCRAEWGREEIKFLRQVVLPRGQGGAGWSGPLCFNEPEDTEASMFAESATVGSFLHFKPRFTAT
jgi:hypothetical protein